MYNAYILLGSNLGDRADFLLQAQAFIISSCGQILQQSSIYETAAWGLTEQPSFFNQVLHLQTMLEPEELMRQLLEIEKRIGRERLVKYGARIIDIDILLIDDRVNNTELLQLPHPLLPERRFALLPLAEIAPTLVHPLYHKSISHLLNECVDSLDVKKINNQTN